LHSVPFVTLHFSGKNLVAPAGIYGKFNHPEQVAVVNKNRTEGIVSPVPVAGKGIRQLDAIIEGKVANSVSCKTDIGFFLTKSPGWNNNFCFSCNKIYFGLSLLPYFPII